MALVAQFATKSARDGRSPHEFGSRRRHHTRPMSIHVLDATAVDTSPGRFRPGRRATPMARPRSTGAAAGKV